MTENRLSTRESEVLKLIALEYTTEEISEALFISHNTVKSHRRNLIDKLEVKNTAGLVRRGFELGILKIDSHYVTDVEGTAGISNIRKISKESLANKAALKNISTIGKIENSKPALLVRIIPGIATKSLALILILIGLTRFPTNLHAQLSEGGVPVSFALTKRSAIPIKEMQTKPQRQVEIEDSISAFNNEPYRYGYHIEANYNLSNSGEWITLDNGDRIWLLEIHSYNAKAIQLLYKDFYLPHGSKLFLYTPDRSQVLGAFTFRNNKLDRYFATALTDGDQVIIEYFEPRSVKNQGRITIERVVHAYRDMRDFQDSQPCHVNVNCAQGAGWENQRDAVARISVQFGNNAGWCTGTLINNTAQDDKLYFLTANHCFMGDLDAEGTTNASQWIFYWNYESPDCNNPANEPALRTTTGATLRANWQDSDFGLFELTESPLANMNINTYFAGWNRSNTPPAGAVTGIHHPAGDIKKLCVDNDPLTSNTTPTNVSGTNYPVDHLWESGAWEVGVTEGGSSGSGLFDANRRLIGQLLGGSSDCMNAGSDVYGKFSKSWTGTGVATRRLSNWLDPGNTGVMTLDGKAPGAVGGNNGYTCATAININAAGTFNAPGPSQGNGAIAGGPGTHANWYRFTPPMTGMIRIFTCGLAGAGNQHNHVYTVNTGSCATLNLNDVVYTEDRGCTQNQADGVKLENVPVTSGVPIYIEWDDALSSNPFTWTLEYQTGGGGCNDYVANNLQINIPDNTPAGVTSMINVPNGGTITDVNIKSLKGTHTYLGALKFTLTSPMGTVVTLIDQACNDNNLTTNFDISLDDQAQITTIPCPYNTAVTVQPQNAFSAFNGQNPSGNWILNVSDNDEFNDVGQLNEWTLEICTGGGGDCPPTRMVDNNPIASGTYQAGTQLTSMGTVGVGNNVTFRAGNNVDLQPNFTVPATSIFEARIGGCQ